MTERPLRFHVVPRFPLESGEVLTDVAQAYHLDGELNEGRDNLVVVLHSLTGGPDAVGAWWSDVFGPGKAIDTRRWMVLCPNLLGSCYGTTFHRGADGPLRPTTRDQARLVGLLVAELGVSSVALVTGGSLGGMVALEWAATFPELTRATVVFAAPAVHSAYATGWNHIQRRAVESFGIDGLALARMVGMMTYRTAGELDRRFSRGPGEDEPVAMRSYLDRHGEKLVARFDAASYLALLHAMDTHDIGRGRGGFREALAGPRGRIVGVGIPGDLLYRDEEVRGWTVAIGAEYRAIHSERGHDAFLLEPDAVGKILTEATAGNLAGAKPSRRRESAVSPAGAWAVASSSAGVL